MVRITLAMPSMVVVAPSRRARRALLRDALLRLVLAVVVVAGALQAHARYFYCEGLGLSATDPCGAARTPREACPLPIVNRQVVDCCGVLTMPAVPEGTSPREPAVWPPSQADVVPFVEFASASSTGPSDGGRGRSGEARRKPPPTPRELRAQLMVFLT